MKSKRIGEIRRDKVYRQLERIKRKLLPSEIKIFIQHPEKCGK